MKKKKVVRCSSGYLNPGEEKLTLCLDLDNTLIYSTAKKLNDSGLFLDNKYYVYKRPYLDDFLITANKYCNLVIYTASIQEYADKVIDCIDKGKLISGRYYRSDCINIDNKWFKDISRHGYEADKVIIIDDLPHCHLKYKSKLIINFREYHSYSIMAWRRTRR
jgi:RNA polymerase II subunit A small phosphatase-like protein